MVLCSCSSDPSFEHLLAVSSSDVFLRFVAAMKQNAILNTNQIGLIFILNTGGLLPQH